MPLVWGDGYCDGFLAVEIFSKKATEGVGNEVVKIIEVEKNIPLTQTHSLAEKLNYLRVPNEFSGVQI